MLRRAALLGLGIVFAMPAGAMGQETVVAEGRIIAGTPHTAFKSVGEVGVDGVDSFFFAAPPAGNTITTRTVDANEFGYDLDFYFFGADGSLTGDCFTEAIDEVCVVPPGSVDGEVAAFVGFDLAVTVLDITPPTP